MEVLLMIPIFVLAIWFCFVLPYEMAVERNRNGILWVLIGLFTSPILAIIILAIIGKA